MPRPALALVPAAPGPARAPSENDIKHLVALHAAASDATAATGDLRRREELRAMWVDHLEVIWLRHDPDFALAFLPTPLITETVAFAVHLATGTVFDPNPTVSTSDWLARLRESLDEA